MLFRFFGGERGEGEGDEEGMGNGVAALAGLGACGGRAASCCLMLLARNTSAVLPL